MTLRPYQRLAVERLERRLKRCRRVLAVAPTGSGKTVVGAAIVKRLRGKRVLWLAHRVELLRQARAHLVAAGVPPADVGILTGVEKERPSARVLVASIRMFLKHELPQVDLIVIDEAHHVSAASYQRVLSLLPSVRVLGLTATPWRLDGAPLGDVFRELLVLADTDELIADGYIKASVVYSAPIKRAERLAKELKTSGADYALRKADVAMRRTTLVADVVLEWQRLANGRTTIVYACSLKHAESLAARFMDAGITAEVVDWSTPDEERAAILGDHLRAGRLSTGETTVVVNVGILTEGVDCPPVKCVVLARPTKSLTLYRQMCGRGSRPADDPTQRPIVLDHAGNAWRLGLPEKPVEWSLAGRVRMESASPVKQCSECGAMASIAAKRCAECGSQFPMTETEVRERQGELRRLRAAALERARRERVVRRLAAQRGLNEQWVRRALREGE